VPSELILRPPAKEGRYDATGNPLREERRYSPLVFAPQGRKIATHNFGIREM